MYEKIVALFMVAAMLIVYVIHLINKIVEIRKDTKRYGKIHSNLKIHRRLEELRRTTY